MALTAVCGARVLARGDEQSVMDEPSTGLDPLSEERLREAVQSLTEPSTINLVAHRESTLLVCVGSVQLAQGSVADARCAQA